MIFLQLLNGLLLAYLAWGAIYQFTFSLAGIFFKNKSLKTMKKLRRMAVFIPSYKEDIVILETAKAALKQQYPSNLFEVIVIADSLKVETITQLHAMPIRVIEVQFEKSTKSKALNKALAQLRGDNFDIAIVLDADNVMKYDFLLRVNARFDTGCQALQGRRAAKNEQTGFALLDAASEDVNNHILCKGHQALGLSARLAGSGMAFEYPLFESVMADVNAIGGFDKELELRFTQRGIKVEYDEQTIIFDEKVSQSTQFSRQRSRWLAAQYRYAKRFLLKGANDFISKGNIDFFNKTLQMTLPPRLVIPMVLLMGTVLNASFSSDMTLLWLIAFGINAMSFLFAMPRYCFEYKNLKMWLNIPRAFMATLIALTRLREANRVFIHTTHHV
jgi:cellulose synthase/poly-beta-1,6-N-acetylglucosamine synthase-like glycosyltransferase